MKKRRTFQSAVSASQKKQLFLFSAFSALRRIGHNVDCHALAARVDGLRIVKGLRQLRVGIELIARAAGKCDVSTALDA